MDRVVVFKVGEGSPGSGFPVTVQISVEGAAPEAEAIGRLPPCEDLLHHHGQWQAAYRRLGCGFRLEKTAGAVEVVSLTAEIKTWAAQVQQGLNLWLRSDSFRPIRELLFHHLLADDSIRMILQTPDPDLRRLPWQLWEGFDRYPKAELALSAPSYQRVPPPIAADRKVRILAILGNSQGIDVQVDRQMLADLPQARVTFLVEPQRQHLTDQLWDQPWDLLFFAGHSSSSDQDQTGQIAINPHESLSLGQLRYGLRKAVSNGLRLAIFNSCDGLGLAHELSDLHIPHLILMREPVPDPVAQAFLKYFLARFVQGTSLYLSVREARERLQGLEDRFPFASWLPVICQNLAESPPTWRSLQSPSDHTLATAASPMITLVMTDLVGSTAMKNQLMGPDLASRNQLYFRTILQPHRQKVEVLLRIYGGRVVKTEGDSHFLVFPQTSQAVQWAIDLQLSHRTAPIATPLGSLQVRIALHTGNPVVDGSDYVGQEVDLVARLCDQAQGDQILASEVTTVLARHAGIEGLQLHPHGERVLRGIGAISVYEILYAAKDPNPLRGDQPSGSSGALQQQLDLPGRSSGSRRTPASVALSITIGVLILVLGARGVGFLQPLELWGFDQFLQLRPLEGPDPRFLVIEITETDIQTQNDEQRRGSLSDRALDQLLRDLEALGPRVIGLDVYRDFPVDPQYPGLIRRLETDPRFVTVCKSRDQDLDSPGIPPPPEVPVGRLGFSDFLPDQDGILRRQILYLDPDPASPCVAPYAFSTQLALRYLHQDGISPQFTSTGDLQLGSTVFPALGPRSGGYQGIDTGGHQILLHYRALTTPDQIAPRISLREMLNGQINPATVEDKVVIIGVTAASAGDDWSTPYGSGPTQRIPGAFVQAHMVSQMLGAVLEDRPLLWVWPEWAEGLWIGAWSGLAGVGLWKIRRGSALGLSFGLGIGGLSVVCGLLFLQGGWIPWVPPLLIVIAIGLLGILYPLWANPHLTSPGEDR